MNGTIVLYCFGKSNLRHPHSDHINCAGSREKTRGQSLKQWSTLQGKSKMKALQLAVVLLIVCLSCAEALKCNRCVPFSAGGTCTTRVETCQRDDEVCASVVCRLHKYSYFKRCMKRSDAFILQSTCQVFTCETDRCNWEDNIKLHHVCKNNAMNSILVNT